MKWKNFDIIYATGSSLSAGGGLETDMIKKVYKEKFGVEWENEKDVTFPKYIADHFNCKLVHDSQSGSGVPRLIRRTYEYIEKYGIKVAQKTLFLFEITDPVHRIDMYCDKIKEHLIVNVGYTAEGGLTHCAVQERISPYDRKYDKSFFDGEINADIRNYVMKYHDPIVYTQKMIGELIGLFSFLEQNKIEYFYMFESGSLWGPFDEIYSELHKKRRLCLTKDCNSINHYCSEKKLTIKDETEGFTDDTHPGYFGNKEFAKDAIEFITNKLKPKIYVLGDSFTHTFQGHYDGDSEWFKKYLNYKQYIPKHFADVLSEYYDCEVVNWGFNGVSNQAIFKKFIEDYKKIGPNDIVIFGWTSISRFMIANELNMMVNIIPFANHPKQNDEVDINTTEQIGMNRANYSVYWNEIIDYIKIIGELLETKKVLHWTWVTPESTTPERLFSDSMIKDKQCINFVRWRDADESIKSVIEKDSDLVIDLTKKIDLVDIGNFIEKGMKVILINSEGLSNDRIQEIQSTLRPIWCNYMDHKAECYKLMIPYKKYETIYEETNGLVNDLHYGEKGSIDLGNDLIKHIDEFFEPIFMRGAEFFDDRSDMKIGDITPVETIKKIIKSII